MVVPELRPWRAAGPQLERIANAVRPHLARAAAATGPRLVRGVRALRPRPSQLPRPRSVRTWQYTAGATAAGLALAAGVVSVAGPWDADGQRTAERDRAAALERSGGADHGGSGTAEGAPRPAPSAAPVLAGLDAARSPVGTQQAAPGGKALSGVLEPLLNASALGGTHTAAVVDVATGRRVYGADDGKALTPASTTKIATAVAALSALGPDHRLTTRTALEPDTGELVLVGGGDPTLTARTRTSGGWAGLRTLAADTARALRERGIRKVTLSYDTTLYSGPALHPIGVNDNLAPVSALTVDEGRTDNSSSGPAARVSDPAKDAAGKFAGFLKDAGITTTPPGPSKASTRAQTLASVSSPPLSALVERMLTNSDNDIAEHLARQTALASGRPGSFDGGAEAISARLTKLGLPMSGASFHDGSGLDRDDRLTADLLTGLLATAGDPDRPGLRPVLTGLPVAGFTGTLADRYTDSAAGVVRAKTGTLTGVNTLAGTVVDADGRLLAFAFMASGTANPAAAESALDRTATALASCGCR
ncbi:D-alanyl-D-alanine carboxypeptidase/D-alanyl-D-alanine endopeptidase [Streptomyces alanosinicus]|uniref:D-alanyl-D-alanine carboxypeptidase n=1 Tax=Streptomyces alanosinicus TaxID=68171 RepID=A0A918YKK4_9ACTN|nr:D-alanyl-D-alanine carboxypeptidase/D-alanyl-D-alanine-endopeptidase [Streptomyces alanosinicus]GHE07111.1 D-alanyl-D-alanine carboxypeptidase [Streptomyces alanosinicus]